MKKRRIALFILFAFILTSFGTRTSASTSSDFEREMRVGLKELYEMVESIQISNSVLVMGYGEGEDWDGEATLGSTEGFLFTPADSPYLVSEQYFISFEECNQRVNELREMSVNAYVGTVSPEVWKIYIEDVQVPNILDKLEYKAVADNGLRTKMNYSDGYPIIFENVDHPSFITTERTDQVPVINLGKRSYRGKIEIGRYEKKGVTAINIVGLEDYLYGVVPAEIISSWPMESLKAQAVAARSFAIYNMRTTNKYANEAYTLCDTIISQVYKGFTGETASCNQAVEETKNQAIYFDGEVIPAYFFSTSGGHTEDSQNVWSGTVPYLKGVPDLFETEPEKKPWVKGLKAAEIEEILRKYDVNIGKLLDIQVTKYTNSGRAMSLQLVGTEGNYELMKETMRVWLGLNSRKFSLVKSDTKTPSSYIVVTSSGNKSGSYSGAYVINGSLEKKRINTGSDQLIAFSKDNIKSIPMLPGTENTYHFIGQGNGHGVGMSQSGAKGMALQGFDYRQILQYYFKGVEIK